MQHLHAQRSPEEAAAEVKALMTQAREEQVAAEEEWTRSSENAQDGLELLRQMDALTGFQSTLPSFEDSLRKSECGALISLLLSLPHRSSGRAAALTVKQAAPPQARRRCPTSQPSRAH